MTRTTTRLMGAASALALAMALCVPAVPSYSLADEPTDPEAQAPAEEAQEGQPVAEDSADAAPEAVSGQEQKADRTRRKGASSGKQKGRDASASGKDDTAKDDPADAEKLLEDVAKATAKGDARAGDASSAASALASATSELKSACDELAKLRKRRGKLSASVKRTDEEIGQAQDVLSAVDDELSTRQGAGLAALLSGEAQLDDVDAQRYLLQKVAADRTEAIGQAQDRRAKQERKLKKVKKAIKKQERAVEEAVQPGNEAAARVEKHTSEVRVSDRAAAQAADAVPDELADDAKDDVETARSRHDATRKDVDSVVAEWYELTEAALDDSDVRAFGVGGDFALSEDEFVGKWGPAIDAFFEDFSHQAGEIPLAGQGETMAKRAYEYKQDPRLCAAVSIVESTGGKYCIKSCNAWGWGAADSDPYGGAAAWGSWDEAIEAWHRGIAESKTGLATARTLDELGAIYCSTPTWSMHVAGYMEQISGFAS